MLVTKGISTRSKDATGAPGLTTRNKKILVTKGIATRSKDATRGFLALLLGTRSDLVNKGASLLGARDATRCSWSYY